MATIGRRPWQGLANIIRFNWHFYLLAGVMVAVLILSRPLFPEAIQAWVSVGLALGGLSILVSLLVSWYIYDLSALYQLPWLRHSGQHKMLNIHAGFDETSALIAHKFSELDLRVCDFYDPSKHTEVSIQRARRAYPPYPNTIPVQTHYLPFAEGTFDTSLAILSAHEIRVEEERVQFFKELSRVTKPSGEIIVTEHLRDLPNFLAYTIGFLHFHSRASWIQTFQQAQLTIQQEVKTTPFITTFILKKNGPTL